MTKQSIYQAKYEKQAIIRISLKLNKKYDKDIIDNIKFSNKQGSIKELIRKGIKEEK